MGDFHKRLLVRWLAWEPPLGVRRVAGAVRTEEGIGEGDEHAHDADEGHFGGLPCSRRRVRDFRPLGSTSGERNAVKVSTELRRVCLHSGLVEEWRMSRGWNV